MRKALLIIVVFIVVGGYVFFTFSKKKADAAFLGGHENADVIVVVIDALRADRMTPYYMPEIQSIMEERGAVVFTQAIAQASWTAPSVASIFTGLHPSVHNVLSPESTPLKGLALHKLANEFQTIAETFSNAGYRTAGFVPNVWISSHLGFSQGFDDFRDLPFKENVESVTQIALDWLRDLGPDDKYFMYLHLMDVHGPYIAPQEYSEKFQGDHPDRQLTREQYDMLGYLGKGSFDIPVARNLATYQQAYDGGVAYADEKLAAFLEKVYSDKRGRRKPIVVIMSDHGEAFFEHGRPDHGYTVFDEEIKVPLIIIPPDGISEKYVSNHPVALVDLYPTLVEMTGVAPPDYAMSGLSLSCALANGAECRDRVTVSSTYIRGPRRVAVRTDSFKGIHTQDSRNGVKVFDLKKDPHEHKDLSSDAELVKRAGELLEKIYKINEASGPDPQSIRHEKTTMTKKQLERLKSLGYLR